MVGAILAGLVAVVLGAQWIGRQSQLGVNKVVVLAVDVQLGSRIGSEMLKLVDWPSSSVPQGAFNDAKDVDGRVAKVGLQRGEPVLESKLAPVGTRGGLSAVVTEGKRAITVRVNDVVGVAGFALPGNYVDIMVSTQQETSGPNGQEHKISKIVLERILVLAVAQEAGRDETKPKLVNAVTLEVTPDQAEKLDLARSVGSLSLVLRNQVDPQHARTDGATKAALLNAPVVHPALGKVTKKVIVRESRPPTSAAPKPKVEMIKGMQKSTTEL
jgi:pilus assembly protein CpaB